jgi:thiol-disulfide isomerase/thioredoxin
MRAVRLSIFLFTASISASALACPGCREAIKGSGGFWASSFNISIVFMLTVVFSLIGFVSYKVYSVIKKEQARSVADGETVHAAGGYWTKVTLPVCALVLAVLMILGTVGSAQSSGDASASQYASMESVQSDIAKGQGDLLLTFKSDTCSICLQMKPEMESIARDYGSKVKMVSVNTKTSQPLVKQYNVDNLPCSVLIHNGKEAGRIEGLATEQELRAWLDERVK